MKRLLPFLLLSSCTWVTEADKDALEPLLDEDGDGYNNEVDCDPADPAIHPKAEEIWYDGVDQNCDKINDFDEDGDGFIAAGMDAKQAESTKPVDQLPGGDCCDANPMISPKQPDVWYDGVDQDCDGKDDFDKDADLYPADEAVATTILAPICPEAMQEPPVGTDCEDDVATINPGVEEAWYDGIDSNCDGVNDYDQDEDGQMSAAEGKGEDCDDTNALVYEGATEVWYDGIDENCDGLNDYDQDGDGFIKEGQDQNQAAHETLLLPGGDCDDETVSVNPYIPEDINDKVDADCDGNTRTFRLNSLNDKDFSFTDALSVQYGELHGALYLGISTNHIRVPFSDGSHQDAYDGFPAIVWNNSADATIMSSDYGLQIWGADRADTVRTALAPSDMQVSNGVLYSAGLLTQSSGASNFPRLTLYRSDSGTTFVSQRTQNRSSPEDVSIAVDANGTVYGFTCDNDDPTADGGKISYLAVDKDGNQNSGEYDLQTPVCAAYADTTGVYLVAQEDAGTGSAKLVSYLVTWDINTAQVVLTATSDMWDADANDLEFLTDSSGNYMVLADHATGQTQIYLDGVSHDIFGRSSYPIKVDLQRDDLGRGVAGYISQAGTATFAYDTGAGYSTIDITLPADFYGDDIAVWPVSSTGVYVAVAGTYATSGVSDVVIGLVKL